MKRRNRKRKEKNIRKVTEKCIREVSGERKWKEPEELLNTVVYTWHRHKEKHMKFPSILKMLFLVISYFLVL